MTTLIHITHEAREKMGGIGAVLEGLLTARAYQEAVERTLLVGNASLPLQARPPGLEDVLYETGPAASADGCLEPSVLEAFARIERELGVRILYGRKRVCGPLQTRFAPAETVLLDVGDVRPEPVNDLKRRLWEAYGLPSDRFEDDWGYEEWVRMALPTLEVVAALVGRPAPDAVLVSHEFMGLPTVLAARRLAPDLKTVYWAHEVPPVRDLLEQETGHRLLFDQAIRTRPGQRSYESILRDAGGYKHALVSRACRAHAVFAVSDRTAQELALLSEEFRRTRIDVVYNGLPARPIDLETRLASRDQLGRYVRALVGFRPDYVFTHVTRPVASKSLERDLAVLEHLDDRLAEGGRTGVLLVLASDAGRRPPELVRAMEAEYGWPVRHRVGWPDLAGGEVPFGRATEKYNEWARVTRAILVNQFGFDRESCGERVPEEVSFQDLRQGSDVEFGQSAYEPFGIAQLETLAFGGICVLSRVCGCAQFVARVADEEPPPNILIAHYGAAAEAGLRQGDVGPETPPSGVPDSTWGAALSPGEAKRIEHEVAAQLARQLSRRLPTRPDELGRLLESGWELAEKMSWQAVCRDYVVPALRRVLGRPTRRRAPEAAGTRKDACDADEPEVAETR